MEWGLFFLFLCACAAAAATGAMFQPGAWYQRLDKPPWTPPNWAFPVVWTTLYLCIAYAAARVAVLPDSGYAMALWAVQIAFNTLWTPVFFGLRRMKAAMVVLAALWLAVAATLVAFLQLDLIAGLLFVPYLAWVTTAGALNFSVWRRNPSEA
ncbi:tryptophan-rich sensory protein TspO [Tranquillimonas alkanivorans]|uniref:TspO and MBR related proteins n=1 Tax=Tranquillimonas alkanivorans TaxID=441119 RepID=A0A1I5LBE8_9RHOB|nr:TspO/MBR family protein [Tranquillimonas alkanivorans]SFO94694.1 TspO and MBR related proteins [Tranquillimonas alkanivorans]